MSELFVFALRILFLVLLWLFIFFIAHVIRTDMWGRAIPTDPGGVAREAMQPPDPPPPVAQHTSERQSSRRRKRPKYVTVENGPLAGRTFLTTVELGIGRTDNNAIILADDFASGYHAKIVPTADGVFLYDLGSTNGTFLNDVQVIDPQQLHIGDVIRIGRTTMALGQ